MDGALDRGYGCGLHNRILRKRRRRMMENWTLSITHNGKEIDRVQIPKGFDEKDVDRVETDAAARFGLPREEVQSWIMFDVLPEAADILADTIDAIIEKHIEHAPVQ